MLGGALSPIDGIDPEDLRIAELLERVNGDVSEVVLAAVNEAIRSAQELASAKMGGITGGLGGPGGIPGLPGM